MPQKAQVIYWEAKELSLAIDLATRYLKDDLEGKISTSVQDCNCQDHIPGHPYHLVVTFSDGSKVFVDYVGHGEFSVDGSTIGRSVDIVVAALKKERLG